MAREAGSLKEKTKWTLSNENLWEIILFNDDYTPIDLVIIILLESSLACTPQDAIDFAMLANDNGSVSLRIAPFESARMLYNDAMDIAIKLGCKHLGFELKEVEA